MLTETTQLENVVQAWKEISGKNGKWNWGGGINKKKTEEPNYSW